MFEQNLKLGKTEKLQVIFPIKGFFQLPYSGAPIGSQLDKIHGLMRDLSRDWNK
jgi:hypothetical protein